MSKRNLTVIILGLLIFSGMAIMGFKIIKGDKAMADSYFIKLYKVIDGELHYWESWNKKKIYTIHWGKVGDNGDQREVKSSLLLNAKDEVVKEEKDKRSQGYKELDDLKTIFIQYKIDGFGTPKDLDKRYEIENLMNENLGWTGVGHCDGGEIGSGTMNIFCLVVDISKAKNVIKSSLEKKDLLNGAIIVEENEEDLKVLYPDNYKGKISY